MLWSNALLLQLVCEGRGGDNWALVCSVTFPNDVLLRDSSQSSVLICTLDLGDLSLLCQLLLCQPAAVEGTACVTACCCRVQHLIVLYWGPSNLVHSSLLTSAPAL